jgi:hypothetical protein
VAERSQVNVQGAVERVGGRARFTAAASHLFRPAHRRGPERTQMPRFGVTNLPPIVIKVIEWQCSFINLRSSAQFFTDLSPSCLTIDYSLCVLPPQNERHRHPKKVVSLREVY